MGTKGWIIFIAAAVILIGGLAYMSTQNRLDVDEIDTGHIIAPSDDNGNIGDHVFGNKDAKVVLIEYGDYQCPGCEQIYPFLKNLSEKHKDSMAFIFRNYPLSSMHPNAKIAAAAAEAAGLQGKFWEMHNQLYEKRDWTDASPEVRTGVLAGLAGDIGLNTDKIKADINSPEVKQKINFDLAIGKKDGVHATPTLILNGKQLESTAQESVEEAVQDALEKVGVNTPKEEDNK